MDTTATIALLLAAAGIWCMVYAVHRRVARLEASQAAQEAFMRERLNFIMLLVLDGSMTDQMTLEAYKAELVRQEKYEEAKAIADFLESYRQLISYKCKQP